jgi:hypothetical protein
MNPSTQGTSGRIVCVSGDFCSGSTLVYTLFRQTGLYHCLYEPLHEDLREFLVYGLRAEEHSHHFFVDQYHTEFKGLRRTGALFRRRWGLAGLHLSPVDSDEDLHRYLSYLFEASLERAPRMMFKENRITFRLGWFRANFPEAKVIHIYRGKEAQWRSIVRRVEAVRGGQAGEQSVQFNGFGIATWCEDLKGLYPELEAAQSQTGFERFAKLWERSYRENVAHADVSIAYEDLLRDPERTMHSMFEAVGIVDIDVAALSQFVGGPQKHGQEQGAVRGALSAAQGLADRALRRYASVYARLRWPTEA